MKHVAKFWEETERYHDLAETVDMNVEIDYPEYVTSDRLSPYTAWSSWNTTTVKYWKYTGPRVVNIE